MAVHCGPMRDTTPDPDDAKINAAVCARCAELSGREPYIIDFEVDDYKQVVCHIAEKMGIRDVYNVGEKVPLWCGYILEHLLENGELVVPLPVSPSGDVPEDLWGDD